MNYLKQALTEERVTMPLHPLWLEEGESLEWIADKGKVMKSINSSDDLLQPIAGALFNLEMNECISIELPQVVMTEKDKQMKKQEDEYIEQARRLHQEVDNFYYQERRLGKDDWNKSY